MSTKREVILRYAVHDGVGVLILIIEQRDSGRVYLLVKTDEGRADGYVPTTEIELTPGLLQELRRALVKLA